MNYGSLFHKSIKLLMIGSMTVQILGSSLISMPIASADGPEILNISRTDSLVSNTNIGSSTTTTGLSF